MEYFTLGEFTCPQCEQPHPLDVEYCPATGQALDAVHKMGGTLLSGRYRVREVLAEGGMGVVYRCEHRSMGSSMAVKFLNVQGCESREAYDRFLREARLAASIDHPGIVKTFDLGITHAGVPYIVMELLSGQDLATRLAERPRLEASEAVSIAMQVLEPLVAVHASGIIHRDLKPENVFLARQSGGDVIVKILDFGISRLAAGRDVTGADGERNRMYGTPLYMSPEQIRADGDVDPRADLWSVGVMLFEMLTGRTPFEGKDESSLMVRVLNDPVPALDSRIGAWDPRIGIIVQRSLQKVASDRYRSASEMHDALAALSDALDHERPPPDEGPSGAQPRTSRYRLVGGIKTENVISTHPDRSSRSRS